VRKIKRRLIEHMFYIAESSGGVASAGLRCFLGEKVTGTLGPVCSPKANLSAKLSDLILLMNSKHVLCLLLVARRLAIAFELIPQGVEVPGQLIQNTLVQASEGDGYLILLLPSNEVE